MSFKDYPYGFQDWLVDSDINNLKWIHVGLEHWYLFAGTECIWIQKEPPFGYDDCSWGRRPVWKDNMWENGTTTSHFYEDITGEECIHKGYSK